MASEVSFGIRGTTKSASKNREQMFQDRPQQVGLALDLRQLAHLSSSCVLGVGRLDCIVLLDRPASALEVHVWHSGALEFVVQANSIHHDSFRAEPVVELSQPDL